MYIFLINNSIVIILFRNTRYARTTVLGMGVTALESFSFGVPIITFPRAQSVPSLVHGKLIFLSYLDANN